MTDTPHVSAWSDDDWAHAFADALREQRSRVREFLSGLAARQRRAEAELESWIQDGAARGPGRAEPCGGVLDWEAEKRRILAALEAECDPADQSAESPRIQIEEIVRRTGLVVAAKDREIADLKRLLEHQSANLGSVAVGAAAVGGILDQDAIIQEERENLRRTQAEWQEKLRQAEIEISIERAKLARQRAEIDEALRAQGLAQEKLDAHANAAPKAEKSPSGRWLARLGLKDAKGPS